MSSPRYVILAEESESARLPTGPGTDLDIVRARTQIDNYTGAELGDLIRRFGIKNPETQNDLSEPEEFNLMFQSSIGPTGHIKGCASSRCHRRSAVCWS